MPCALSAKRTSEKTKKKGTLVSRGDRNKAKGEELRTKRRGGEGRCGTKDVTGTYRRLWTVVCINRKRRREQKQGSRMASVRANPGKICGGSAWHTRNVQMSGKAYEEEGIKGGGEKPHFKP